VIAAYPGQTFEAILIAAPHGLVGTLTFSIVNPETSEVVLAPRTTGITEPVSGTYQTTAVAPPFPRDYVVVWSHGSDTATEGLKVEEALTTRPTVQDVALLLRTRTVGPSSGGLGGDSAPGDLTTFSSSTRPKATEVESIIGTAQDAVMGMLRKPLPADEDASVRHAIAIYAAIVIETSFFRENSNADALAALRGMLRDTIANVNETVVLNQGRGFGTLNVGTTYTGKRSRLAEDVIPGLDT
jgi:hypothetical protein